MNSEPTIGQASNDTSNRRNPLLVFFTLTYLISWGLWFLMVTLALSLKDPLRSVINGLAIFGLTLAGLILTTAFTGWMDYGN